MLRNFLLVLIIKTSFSFAQDFEFKTNYDVLNKSMIQNYFNFEGINFSQNTITSNFIKDKNFILNLKEYKNGQVIKTTCLVKSDNQSYAMIDSTKFNFSILGKRIGKNFEICLFFERFYTKKYNLKLIYKFKNDYIFKDVLLKQEDLKLNKPFIFLLLTTPEYFKDGSASWCEVAASETPEKIYQKNKIPHFFVFEMTIEE